MPAVELITTIVFVLAFISVFLFWFWILFILFTCLHRVSLGKERFLRSMQRLGLHEVSDLQPNQREQLFTSFGQIPFHISHALTRFRRAPMPASTCLRVACSDSTNRVVFGLLNCPGHLGPITWQVVCLGVLLPQAVSKGTAILSFTTTKQTLGAAPDGQLLARLRALLPSIEKELATLQCGIPFWEKRPVIDVGYSNGYAVIAVRTWPTTGETPQVYAAMYRVAAALNNGITE